MKSNKVSNFVEKIETWQKINLPVLRERDKKLREFFEENPEVKAIIFTIGDSVPMMIHR